MSATEYLDRPPPGWFVLDVMKTGRGRGDWCALMIDVDPDELKHCVSKEAWIPIPGKHRTREDAWDELENLIATRH